MFSSVSIFIVSLISTGWFDQWNFPLRFNLPFECLEPLQYLQTETFLVNLEAAWKGLRTSIPSQDERLCPSWRENSFGTSDHCCELCPFFEYFTLIDEIINSWLLFYINRDRERHHMANLNFYSLKSSLLFWSHGDVWSRSLRDSFIQNAIMSYYYRLIALSSYRTRWIKPNLLPVNAVIGGYVCTDWRVALHKKNLKNERNDADVSENFRNLNITISRKTLTCFSNNWLIGRNVFPKKLSYESFCE